MDLFKLRKKREKFSYSEKESEKCKKVVISSRAYASIISEALSRNPLETGGILLGNYNNGIWYIVEATDPGMTTYHSVVHHEMDNKYHNHIYPVLSRLYKNELTLIGFWHRHPGSLDRFSTDDNKSNERYAKIIENGTLSFLLNFDPKARLTCYYLDYEGTGMYHRPKVEIGDMYFKDTNYLDIVTEKDLLKRGNYMYEEKENEECFATINEEEPLQNEPMNEKSDIYKIEETCSNRIMMNEQLSNFLDKKLKDVEEMDYSTKNILDKVYAASEGELLEGFLGRNKKRKFQMVASNELLCNDGSEYEVGGIFREETEKYYLISDSEHLCNKDKCSSKGIIVNNEHYLKLLNPKAKLEGYDYFGTFINDGWVFTRLDDDRSNITVNFIDVVTRLFSRNTGLLESDIMSQKTALIIGCGSVGSLIALELARAGVGKFILVDGDTLEIHNICRHQLGFKDLGRYKVDAMLDAIHNINPLAEVKTYRGNIQEMPMEYIEKLSQAIIVGTGDNRESSAYGNDLAKSIGIPFVSTGCWTRAYAGECFYWYPDVDLPTYREAHSGMLSGNRPVSHQNYFADDADERALNFEPGISTDISFVTLVAVKVIYDLLNKDSKDYTKRVINYLTNNTFICNTNDPKIGGEMAEMFPNPLFISNNVYARKAR